MNQHSMNRYSMKRRSAFENEVVPQIFRETIWQILRAYPLIFSCLAVYLFFISIAMLCLLCQLCCKRGAVTLQEVSDLLPMYPEAIFLVVCDPSVN